LGLEPWLEGVCEADPERKKPGEEPRRLAKLINGRDGATSPGSDPAREWAGELFMEGTGEERPDTDGTGELRPETEPALEREPEPHTVPDRTLPAW